jgi:hypothetical protein
VSVELSKAPEKESLKLFIIDGAIPCLKCDNVQRAMCILSLFFVYGAGRSIATPRITDKPWGREVYTVRISSPVKYGDHKVKIIRVIADPHRFKKPCRDFRVSLSFQGRKENVSMTWRSAWACPRVL